MHRAVKFDGTAKFNEVLGEFSRLSLMQRDAKILGRRLGGGLFVGLGVFTALSGARK